MAWQASRLPNGQGAALFIDNGHNQGSFSILSGPRPQHVTWNANRTELTLSLEGVHGLLHEVDQVYGFHVEWEKQSQPFIAYLKEDRLSIRFQFEHAVPQD